MKRLLNTLYVTSVNRYLSLDGENVVVLEDREEIGRVPLHNLQGIVTFGYTGASPALMGECARRNIDLTFMSGHGRFLARVTGEVKGNVTLRKEQYRVSEDRERSICIDRHRDLGCHRSVERRQEYIISCLCLPVFLEFLRLDLSDLRLIFII